MHTILYYLSAFVISTYRKISDIFWYNYCIGYCKKHHTRLGQNIQFKGHCVLKFHKNSITVVGDNFVCNSGIVHSIDNKECSKLIVGKDAELIIGSNSGISNTCIHCHTKVIIGNNVNIGAGTIVFDTNFHSTNWRTREDRLLDTKLAKTAPVVIGDNVFIGANCIICKGVTIGNKSIIAAGSVITKHVPENEVWGGNPAQLIYKME